MWTHTRIAPSSSRSALIASSKSRAVGGSIVNVGRSRRSVRGDLDRRPLGGGPRLALDQRVEAAAQPAVEHQRLEHVARHVGAPEPAQHAAVPGARPARRHEHEVAHAGVQALLGPVDVDPAPAREERLGDQEAAAPLQHRDDRVGPAARAAAERAGRGRPALRRAHVASRATVLTATSSASSLSSVLASSSAWTSGSDAGALLDAAAAEVAPVGREVLARR